MKLLPYELFKIYLKRDFQIFIIILLGLNMFFMWYLNIPTENELSLFAYQKINEDICEMSEEEKLSYITEHKEILESVIKVEEIIQLNNMNSEMGEILAKQAIEQLGLDDYVKYQKLYESNEYLVYTDSLYQEKILFEELYREIEAVFNYEKYLDSIQQNRDILSNISIFSKKDNSSFGSRNIEKSAIDHIGLNDENIRWFPSKGVKIAEGNIITELLLLLSILLFVGNLITEEKEKGLFHIIRTSKNGIVPLIMAKILALFVHCLIISFLFCNMNLLFAKFTVGIGDMSAAIQSISTFLESNLKLNLWQYFLFGIVTKGFVLFAFGLILTAVSIISQKKYLSQLAGVGIISLSYFFYTLIPAFSILAPIKYLSLFGILKSELLYGGYLNFNIFDYPISRLTLSLLFITVICFVSIVLCIILFIKGNCLEIKKNHKSFCVSKKYHNSLLIYEGSKILFMEKAMIVLILFTFLIGYNALNKRYTSSIHEQYYREWMLSLEGDLTAEKESSILKERSRYEEAFAQIEKIDNMIDLGKLDERIGNEMKYKWNNIISFYPAFQKIMYQYEHIRQNGGVFIYDTGYAYLFGKKDNHFLLDFLLLSCCMVFTFCNSMAMENDKNSWNLISSTAKGKQSVINRKVSVCSFCTVMMVILPWIFHIIAILREYPLHGWFASIQNIPQYFMFKFSIPIWLFLILAIFFQMIAVLLVNWMVLFLSAWRKSYLQTIVLGLLMFAVPLTLSLMGFDFTKWISFYFLYALISFI